MSFLEALLVAEARQRQRAARSASVRHRRLAAQPFVIMPWQLGAEPFTAAAVAWGFEPSTRKIAVPGEPRDRELAFRALLLVAREFNPWIEGVGRTEPAQVVVPNRGAVTLLGRLGRRLAYLSSSGEFSADPDLITFGKHLKFLFDRSRFPGQQLIVSLTDLLSSHWVSELSGLEAQHLPALDAAIEPPRGKTSHEAAFKAESTEIGPLPSGKDDEAVDVLLAAFNEQRQRRTDENVVALLRKPIEAHYARLVDRGWGLLFRCLDRERSHPEAPHVARRWEEDQQALSRHLDWTVARGGRYRTRQTSLQAAFTLRSWEDAQRLLEAEEAIDDPLRMIPTLLANQGVAGTVRRFDRDNFEQGAKNRVRRPIVEVETGERCTIPVGKVFWWTKTPGKREYVVDAVQHLAGGKKSLVTLKLETGADQELPSVGDLAIFSVHSTHTGQPLKLPQQPPWTHADPQPQAPPLEGAADQGRWE